MGDFHIPYQIKTASDLKYAVEQSRENPHFFTRDTMKFFGDTMKNYGVRLIDTPHFKAYELYRRKPVKHGLKSSVYFSAVNFKRILNTPEGA